MNDKEKFVLEKYDITEDGRVFSKFTNKYLKYRVDKDGYFDISLVYDKNGNRMPFRIHRLVAIKYIDNPNDYDIVNHKDLNKQNNNKTNLEWTTVQLNTQHAYNYCAYNNVKKVKSIEIDGMERIFPSVSHASRFYKYSNPSTIQAILEGRKKNPISSGKRKGLRFEYTSESVTTIERITDTNISK